MKVMVDFALHGSLIEFTPFLGDDIEEYQKAFEDWYYGETAKSKCRKKRSDLNYEYFNVDVVIDWIKEVAPEANPVLLEKEIGFSDIDRTIPAMYF